MVSLKGFIRAVGVRARSLYSRFPRPVLVAFLAALLLAPTLVPVSHLGAQEEPGPQSVPAEDQVPPQVQEPAPVPPPRPGPSLEELAAIRSSVEKSNAETARLLAQLADLDARIFGVNQTIQQGESRTSDLQTGILLRGEEVARLDLRFQELKRRWNEDARQTYTETLGAVWAPLFMARTWSDLGKVEKFWKNLAGHRTKLVQDSIRFKEKLLTEKADLQTASENLATQSRDLSKAREKLRQAREKRTASLGQLRHAIGQAMAAQQAALSANTLGLRIPHGCSAGQPEQDRRLAELLDWYAPAAGPEPFMPPKLAGTGVVLNVQSSWYGPTFEGCRASSGSTFRSNQMTAASLTLPFGTLVKVTNAGKSAVVVITDRGPYVPGRELDLSQAAAEAVGLPGVGQVVLEILAPVIPPPIYP
ncbi:MAG: septal ring lytic transglycosylase RlpA family protein [Actinomycetota bacterium]